MYRWQRGDLAAVREALWRLKGPVRVRLRAFERGNELCVVLGQLAARGCGGVRCALALGRGRLPRPNLYCVTGQYVRADAGSSALAGADWRLAVERPIVRVRPVHPWDRDDGWLAVLGIRRDLKLQVSGHDAQPVVMVEAWAGEPGDAADGVAVVRLTGSGLALARVPLCGCGERGCVTPGFSYARRCPARTCPSWPGSCVHCRGRRRCQRVRTCCAATAWPRCLCTVPAISQRSSTAARRP